MDYLLEDRRKVVEDLGSEFGWQAWPNVGGLVWHSSSHCSAGAISSVNAAKVSLVEPVG